MANALTGWDSSEDAELVVTPAPKAHWALAAGPRVAVGALLVLSLALGGRAETLYGLVKIGLYLAGAALVVELLRRPNIVTLRLPRTEQWLLGLLGAFLLCGIFSVLPLPLRVIELLSSSTAELYRNAGSSSGSIALLPAATVATLGWAGALGVLFFWLAALPFRDSKTHASSRHAHSRQKRARNGWFEAARSTDATSEQVQVGIIWVGVLVGVVGLLHWALRFDALFGIFAEGVISPSEVRAHWPFISANHLADFLGVIALLCAARIARLVQLRRLRRPKEETDNVALRLLRSPMEFGKVVPYALALLVLVLCALLTLSRAGVTLLFVGFAALWLVTLRYPLPEPIRAVASRSNSRRTSGKRLRSNSGKVAFLKQCGILAFGLLALSFFLGGTGRHLAQQRLEYGLASGIDENRFLLAETTLDVIRNYPLFGVGLGAWHSAAARYIPPELAAWKLDYAHNEYLQFIAEMGLVGAFFIVSALVAIASSSISALRLPLQPTERIEIVGSGVALLLPLLHSLVDFPFHLPATALLSVLVLSLHLRQCERVRQRYAQ
ncbi:MAG: O-antigen ligase family protein [Bdellovibrionales bacterium]|nr:O-antigen ligase family protein [Bdellovibrionales bacterium]